MPLGNVMRMYMQASFFGRPRQSTRRGVSVSRTAAFHTIGIGNAKPNQSLNGTGPARARCVLLGKVGGKGFMEGLWEASEEEILYM